MGLKKNDCLTLKIEDLTNLGFGVAKADGQVVFVSDTVPGDEIIGKIIKVSSSFAVARVEKMLKSSPCRVDNRCGISGCHSCAYKKISYADECAIKEESVRQIFKKCGLDEVKIEKIIPSPAERGYRNKAQYPIARGRGGEYIIGFFAPKSHRVTEAAGCPLAPEIFGEIIECLRGFFEKFALSVYDEESGTGLLRHIYLRRGEVSGEVLLTLVINGSALPHAEELVRLITDSFPSVVGILLNFNRKSTNVILGDEYAVLYGRDHIFDTLAGVRLKITAPSFYQVNHDCAELLYSKARELSGLKESDTVLDLYCGAGSIGLSMASKCREVIGIEIVESAVKCAEFNAKENGIDNASFYTGDAKDTAKLLEGAEKIRGAKISADLVIFDPPRGGCDEALLLHVAKNLAPERIVYISCNPGTLARDMVILKSAGYVGNSVTPVDMFPGTGHVESVVCLERRSL